MLTVRELWWLLDVCLDDITLLTCWYLLLASTVYGVSWVMSEHGFDPRRRHLGSASIADLAREIAFSALSISIFVAVSFVVMVASLRGQMRFQLEGALEDPWHLAKTLVVMFLLHDAYFYWTHRLLHARSIYPFAHALHHRSTHSTPFAALAFHPLEALIQAGIFPLLALVFPIDPYILLFFVGGAVLVSVYIHCGHECLPTALRSGQQLGWLYSSTAHHAHHAGTRGNYGLYFTFWDRCCGTYVPQLESRPDPLEATDHA